MRNKIKNIGIDVTSTSTGASADVLYTVPDRHQAEVTLLNVSDSSNSADTVTIEVYVAEDNEYYFVANTTDIGANSTLYVVGDRNTLNLNPGDKIVISATTATDITAFTSLKETYMDSN